VSKKLEPKFPALENVNQQVSPIPCARNHAAGLPWIADSFQKSALDKTPVQSLLLIAAIGLVVVFRALEKTPSLGTRQSNRAQQEPPRNHTQ
jgi:hypothetical protein